MKEEKEMGEKGWYLKKIVSITPQLPWGVCRELTFQSHIKTHTDTHTHTCTRTHTHTHTEHLAQESHMKAVSSVWKFSQ